MIPIMTETLGDAVITYLHTKIPMAEGQLDFGVLKELEIGIDIESAMIYDFEGLATGSVDIYKRQDIARIVYATDAEKLEFRITPRLIRFKAQLPDQLKEAITHRHALKHDWVTPEPIVVLRKGDYSIHFQAIRQAFDLLYNGSEPQLRIPEPL